MLQKKYKRKRIVLGDIHGCYLTFKTLLETRIGIKKNDYVYLLGDYINKGPESAKTLDYILDLINRGYNIFPIRGNHENEVLTTEEKTPEILPWLLRDSPGLLQGTRLKDKYRKLFKSLPFYLELDDFFLVHAGFNFKISKPFSDKTSMLWLRRFENNYTFTKGKTIIHGHQAQNIEDVVEAVNTRKNVIGLDNGVCYIKKHKIYDFHKMGNLCALNLDTYELFIQINSEKSKKK